MRSEKRQITEGIKLPNQEKIKSLGQKKNGNIGSAHH